MLPLVLLIGTMTKLSWILSKDILTISFSSVVADDLMFAYLWTKVLILYSNSLVTQLFHSANSTLFILFFLDQFSMESSIPEIRLFFASWKFKDVGSLYLDPL